MYRNLHEIPFLQVMLQPSANVLSVIHYLRSPKKLPLSSLFQVGDNFFFFNFFKHLKMNM